MTLSNVDFDSRGDALVAAELEGYDASSVRVTCDRDSGRYQWALREFDVDLDGSSVDLAADVAADTRAAPDGANAAADVVADVVAELVAGGAIGESTVTESEDAPVVGDIQPVTSWMTSIQEPVTSWMEVEPDKATVAPSSEAPAADVVAEIVGRVAGRNLIIQPVSDGSAFGIARVDPATAPLNEGRIAGRNLIMQVHGAMPEMALLPFAQTFADKHMAIVTLRDADSFDVVATLVPGGGKVARGGARVASGSGRVAGSGTGAGVVVAREESIIDRIRRGVWEDSEVPDSNRTILNIKHRIEAAYTSCDLDALVALDTFKSQSTYYNQARAYLTWAIASCRVELAERAERHAKAQAAIDADFGFDKPGVLMTTD